MCATASGGDNTDRYFAQIGCVFVRRRRPLRASTELCKKPMRPLIINPPIKQISISVIIGPFEQKLGQRGARKKTHVARPILVHKIVILAMPGFRDYQHPNWFVPTHTCEYIVVFIKCVEYLFTVEDVCEGLSPPPLRQNQIFGYRRG